MISQIFINRPKFAIVISLVFILAGCLTIPYLPVAEYPEVAPPQVRVSTFYPGASAQDIVDTVAAPLELQMNSLENLLYYSSNATNSGSYTLTLTFKYGTDGDIAQVNVQNAVNRAEPILPTEVKQQGLTVLKMTSDIIGMFALTADPKEYSIRELSTYAKTNFLESIARVDGVANAMMFSEDYDSMRIWLDPLKMSSMGISTAEVSNAIRTQNIQAAAGSVGIEKSNELIALKINVKGRLNQVNEFENIIIRSDGQGRIVKLSDIARVELGSQSYASGGCFDGLPCVVMGIFRNSEANAMKTMQAVREEIEKLEKNFPPGMKCVNGFDPTKFIEISVKEIFQTLIEALVLVVLVTFLFLQDWRATIIPALAIPVSLLGTFPLMYIMGYSINVLTMFALILVIGSLVDDAIVVVENVMTGIENGLTAREAASQGMKQISTPIIAMTLVSCAIYVPIAFYGGMVGEIYKQFAVVMSISLIISMINALTLSPALCVLLLRGKNERPVFDKMVNGLCWPIFKPFNYLMDRTRKSYLSLTGILVRRSLLMILVFGGLVYANYWMYTTIPTSFIPSEDKGALFCTIELPPGASIARTSAVLRRLENTFKDRPGINHILSVAGQSMTGGQGENQAMMIFQLDDWDLRKSPELQLDAIFGQVQQECNKIGCARIMCFKPPAIMGLGVTGGVSCVLCSSGNVTPQELAVAGQKLSLRLMDREQFPETMFALSQFSASTPQLELKLDREKAEMMQVNINDIFTTLQSKLSSLYVNDFNLYGYTFKVQVQSERAYRSVVDNIRNIYIPNKLGQMVPFTAVADVEYTTGPQQIDRYDQYMSAKINAQLAPGTSTGTYMKKMEGLDLGTNYHLEWTDASFQEKQNEGSSLFLLLLSFVFGYLFLVAQYESWTMPVSVMLSVASASLGAMVGMMLWGQTLSIYGQLGLVMLIGLACKNAILMIEFSKIKREEGQSINEAALSGADARFRAVLMTAWSFVLGVIPLVIATGAGANSRVAIGVPTCIGMIFDIFVGRSIVPGLYGIIENIREFFSPSLRRHMKKMEAEYQARLEKENLEKETENK